MAEQPTVRTGRTEQDLLRLLTCGSVDDGKSTLIGRLLYDTHTVPEDQLASLEAESKKFGTVPDGLISVHCPEDAKKSLQEEVQHACCK